ncbi:MAG: hypothetical protein HGA19_06830 [Oscillochloris sp.]|nr:hypothetical protein [Oscillochloris sp.]
MDMYRRIITRGLQAASGLALAVLISTAPAAHAANENTAKAVSLSIEAQPDVAVLNDGVDTYKITVANHGSETMKYISVSVPYASGYQLDSAIFSDDSTWVTSKSNGVVTISVDLVAGDGDSIAGTLRFTGVADTNAVAQRAVVNWSNEGDDYSATSNIPVVTTQELGFTPIADGCILSSSIFASNEPVNFWYTTDNGKSQSLAVINGVLKVAPPEGEHVKDAVVVPFKEADGAGALTIQMSAAGIPVGTYTLVARGNWSGATATTYISVQ